LNKYELMYIIDTQLEEAPRKELIDRVAALITGNGGEVEKIDEWGKRRLAYPIDYKNEGYYVLVNFSAESELPKEIERVLQISDDVLRYLVIRLEEKHTSVKPRPVPVRPVFARPVVAEAASEAPEAPAAEATAEAAPEAPAEAPETPEA
jgi:small subunit ribosomal protein S6